MLPNWLLAYISMKFREDLPAPLPFLDQTFLLDFYRNYSLPDNIRKLDTQREAPFWKAALLVYQNFRALERVRIAEELIDHISLKCRLGTFSLGRRLQIKPNQTKPPTAFYHMQISVTFMDRYEKNGQKRKFLTLIIPCKFWI